MEHLIVFPPWGPIEAKAVIGETWCLRGHRKPRSLDYRDESAPHPACARSSFCVHISSFPQKKIRLSEESQGKSSDDREPRKEFLFPQRGASLEKMTAVRMSGTTRHWNPFNFSGHIRYVPDLTVAPFKLFSERCVDNYVIFCPDIVEWSHNHWLRTLWRWLSWRRAGQCLISI